MQIKINFFKKNYHLSLQKIFFMIQRKQTLYLLLASIFTGSTYYIELWKATGVNQHFLFKIASDLLSLICYVIAVTASFITIFFYNNRKKQINICLSALLTNMLFIFVIVFQIHQMKNNMTLANAAESAYSPFIVLPFISLILIFMAGIAIRKDEKLVKSLDRLR
jgi:Domain of unknown function (DUF4293)